MGRLEITTHIGCPINCTDCPQDKLKSLYKGDLMLSLENFQKALNKVPKGTRIDFSGMCEPFVNPYCTDMILYASYKGYPLALYTTLQGASLSDWQRLHHVEFEVVTIHLPDEEHRSHFRITGKYLELLNMWDCDNYSCHGTINDLVRPYLKNRNLITFMHDRAGNVECRPHIKFGPKDKLTCITSGRDMNHNVLLPNGEVLMCCMDYGMTGVLGNLFTQSYEDVIGSDTAKNLREKLDGGDSICRKCSNARIFQ